MRLPPELQAPTVIPSLISTEIIDRIREQAEQVYALLDEHFDDRFTADKAVQDAYKWGGLSITHLQRHGFGIDYVIEPVIEIIRRRFNGFFLPQFSVFRRIVPEGLTTIKWHCDAEGTDSGQVFVQVWNCWLPLSAVGACNGRPTLEILPDSDKLMLSVPRQWGGYAERDPAWVREHCDEFAIDMRYPIRPSMLPGDALVFSHWHLHRTEPLERMTEGPHHMMLGPRIGFECRFTLGEQPSRTYRAFQASRRLAGGLKRRLLRG